MRRNIFISLLLAFVVFEGNAQPITIQQAEQKALVFMQQKGISLKRGISNAPFSHITTEQKTIYIFNSNDGEGFVIVAGDERTEAILGYSTDSRFDEKKISETMRMWLTEYATQIDDLQKGRTKAKPLKVSTHNAIEKMITSVWNQGNATASGNAYNQLCPTYQGIHCVTGCVATAMAQVMRYHKWPTDNCSQIDGYTSNETIGYVSSLPMLKFDWSHMLDRYDEGQTTQECEAVAQLMQYCGSAVKTNYGTGSSSAYLNDVAVALRTYFDYDVNTRFVNRTDYSAEGWDNMIYEELSNGRPVVYRGSNPGGGHAFVCDGYDGHGFYHINWGWGGYCNGYFKLSILNPTGGDTGSSTSNGGYSVDQEAIVGIQKPTGTTEEMRTLSLEKFTRNGHIISAQYGNRTGFTGTFDYGFAYQDVSIGGNTYKLMKKTDTLEPYNTRYYTLDLDGMNLSDGTYNFYPFAILSGNPWYHMICDFTKYFQVNISDGQVASITYHPVGHLYVNSVECVSNRIVNQPQEIKITIKNEGEEFTDKFYLFASNTNSMGEYVDEVCLPIESGGQETTSLYFTPTSSGKWKVWIDIKEDGSSGLSPREFDIINAPTSESNLSVVSHEIITNTDAILKAKIKNNSSTSGYYMPINCYIFEDTKNYNIDFQMTRNLNIASGETADVEFRFESLEMGKTYTVAMRYYKNHQTDDTDWLDYYIFTVNTPTEIIRTVGDTITYAGLKYKITKMEDEDNEVMLIKNPNAEGAITIPSVVTDESGKYSFDVTAIEDKAFFNCASMTKLSIPSSVRSIGQAITSCCTILNEIKVSDGNPYYNSHNNCNAIIDTATGELLAGCNNTTIPDGVTAIGAEAMRGMFELKEIHLPQGLTRIGNRAFYYCNSLTGRLVIPEGVTVVETYAFYKSTGLTAISLPSTITTLGNCAFRECVNVTSVNCRATTPPTIDSRMFGNYSSCMLSVPSNSLEAYKNASNWKNFYKIVQESVLFADDVELNENLEPVLWIYLDNGTNDFTGYQFTVTLPEGVSLVNKIPFGYSVIGSRYEQDQIISITDVTGEDYIYEVRMFSNNDTPIPGEYGDIIGLRIGVSDELPEGTYTGTITDIVFNTPDNALAYLSDATFDIIITPFPMGDVDHDRRLNITDVMMTVNHVVGQTPAGFHIEEADVNGDHVVNISDIMAIVNLVVNTPTYYAPRDMRETSADAITLTPTTDGYAVTLKNNEPYTALQMDIQMPNDAPLNARLMDNRSDGHSIVCSDLGNGHHRIAIYSLNGHALRGNDGILLQLQTNSKHDALPEIYDVQLTNRLFESVTLSEISYPTDITNVNTDKNDEAPSYNTQGFRASKHHHDIVIQDGRKRVQKK